MKSVPVIRVEHLVKRYGQTTAVNDVSFDIAPGEIFCLVGPNGAGKTTTVECIEGHTLPDAGTITVFGMDPRTSGHDLKQRIGVQLQESNLPDRLKVWEALDLFGSFYKTQVDLDQLMRQLGIESRRNAFFTTLSGGEKQRVYVALALVNDPELIFLDELTTGLDPHARRGIWDLIRSLKERGKTVMLTTHFMDEAECLADRVGIVHGGEIVALDTPARLIEQAGLGNHVNMTVDRETDLDSLRAVDGVRAVEQDGTRIRVAGRDGRLVSGIVRAVEDQGVQLIDLTMERPSLEDVFLHITKSAVYEPVGS